MNPHDTPSAILEAMTPEQQTNNMNNPINNGGPAFPCETYGLRNGKETTIPTNGMTLRDYFAGQAIIGLLSYPQAPNNATLARYAYNLADAMLAAREVKP